MFKRSHGPGNTLTGTAAGHTATTTTTTTTGTTNGATAGAENNLFGSIRTQGAGNDHNLFRRSIHNSSHEATSGHQGQQQQPQYYSVPLSDVAPISKELEDPVAALCVAVDKLVEKMTVVADIHKVLANFNESFGSFLYGLQMNASTVEWTEAPDRNHFERQQQRDEEAELLRKQQEELNQIRQRQLELEQEELERQREEQARLEAEQMETRREAERVAAARATLSTSSRLQRPKINTAGKGGGGGVGTSSITKSRIPGGAGRGRIPRPVASATAAAPSRVGPSGQVRKLVGRVVMKKVAEKLPLKYRDEPHRGSLEAIMRSLAEHIEGQYLPELVAVAGVARHRCNEYLGVLVHAKEVIKTNHKGVLFALNPDRYPSR
ncbi:hypothetical protein BG004_005592 [Podila humilis]|nr:hypothetical protein BG004_005592 [Podila humilis]